MQLFLLLIRKYLFINKMFNISVPKFSISDLKKYTRYIVVFILFGLVIAGYFFWVPKYREFKSNNVQLDVESEKVKLKKDYLFELEGKLNSLIDYQDVISKINSALPVEYSPDSLFSFIQNKASENGLIVSDADLPENQPTVEPGIEGVIINKIKISATVTGKYSSFLNFLVAVYKNSRLIEVKSIKFEHTKEEEYGADLFGFKLSLEASYYKTQ